MYNDRRFRLRLRLREKLKASHVRVEDKVKNSLGKAWQLPLQVEVKISSTLTLALTSFVHFLT
jgi:hypothetical protein